MHCDAAPRRAVLVSFREANLSKIETSASSMEVVSTFQRRGVPPAAEFT
jgi:hypothetical protein